MARTGIYIPKRINVGFCTRRDTYTGKLAYVIYYDEKGKLRKETSWNNWRDKNIPNEEFDNTPTEGFVLNKKVGDYQSGWNHRQAYCRVYDPRGFEFEITIENLLYILENANSIKGKGLEGEFVYGWDGKDLVLMPVDSPDYKEIEKFTQIIQTNNTIKMKDLVIGGVYKDKESNEYVYMGKHPYYSGGYKYRSEAGEIVEARKEREIPESIRKSEKYDWDSGIYQGEYMWFAQMYDIRRWADGESIKTGKIGYSFHHFKGMPKKFIECVSDKPVDNFAEIVHIMEGSTEYSPIDKHSAKTIRYTLSQFKEIIYNDKYSGRYLQVYAPNGVEYCIRRQESANALELSVELSEAHRINVLRDARILNEKGEPKEFKKYMTNDGDDNSNEFEVSDCMQRLGRFLTDKPKDQRYWVRDRSIYNKHAIGLTVEQIFNILEPCFAVEYLKNGRVHRTYNNPLDLKVEDK